MAIFKLIAPPARHRYFSAAYKVKWFSWSDDFLLLLPEIERAARQYGKPVLKPANAFREYSSSYQLNFERTSRDFLMKMKPCLLSLAHFRVGKGLNFFSGLMNNPINGQLYHFIMALFRSMLAQHYQHEAYALYGGPAEPAYAGGRPLQCGLHLPEILWQVTEEPGAGRQGTTLFLPVNTLITDILPGLQGLPASKAGRIEQLITQKGRTDRHEELHNLLYSPENKWSAELREKILLRAWPVKFGKGQGFMIQDRLWMHGISGGAPPKPPHRLIFSA